MFVPSPLAAADRPSLADILREAGFKTTPGNGGAFWIRKGATDEMIEFFTVHHGTARQLGRPHEISGQTALAGIALQHLSLLTDDTRTLEIEPDTGHGSLTVRVPTLGGYVLNKALTFIERLSVREEGILKAAKDVVYIRDVMAGGEAVRAEVRSDITVLVNRNKSRQNLVKTARNRLHRLTTGPDSVLEAAVRQLTVQHRFRSEDAAKADLIGYLEILSVILDESGRGRRRGK